MINSTKIIKANRKAFTLVELLVVIAIIAILIALITVAAGMMLDKAKSTKDMGNQRTLGQATFSHATDHNGKLLHPRTGPEEPPSQDSTQSQIDRMWVAAYGQDANGDNRLVNQGSDYIEMKSALEEGAAFPYIGSVMAYQSPMDPTIGDVDEFEVGNSFTNDRIRSYSLNAFVGVEWGADDRTAYRDNPPLSLKFQGKAWRSTETLSQIPQPSETMCSIGEQDSWGRNGHGWLVFTRQDGAPIWVDFPAFWDGRNVNMSFVDGSTGSITLESDLVEQKWLDHGHNYSPSLDGDDYEHMKDFQKLKKVILPGVEGIGSILDR